MQRTAEGGEQWGNSLGCSLLDTPCKPVGVEHMSELSTKSGMKLNRDAAADKLVLQDVEAGLARGDESDARVVVAPQSPFRIQGANQAFAKLMCVSEELIKQGPSIRLLFGPGTEKVLFEAGLAQAASTMKEQEMQTALYDTRATFLFIHVLMHPSPSEQNVVITFKAGTPLQTLAAGDLQKQTNSTDHAAALTLSSQRNNANRTLDVRMLFRLFFYCQIT